MFQVYLFSLCLYSPQSYGHVFIYRQGHFPPTLKLALSKLFGFELLSCCVRVVESRKKKSIRQPSTVAVLMITSPKKKPAPPTLIPVAQTSSKSDRCSQCTSPRVDDTRRGRILVEECAGGSTPELEGRKFDRFEQNHLVDVFQPVSLGQAAPSSGDKEQ